MHSTKIAPKQCTGCGQVDDSEAKFCPTCGANQWQVLNMRQTRGYTSPNSSPQLVYLEPGHTGTPTLVLPENIPNSVPTPMARALTNLNDAYVPSFAHVRNTAQVQQQQVELAKLAVILARERLFLLFHFIVWGLMNIVGFTLALKCYNEFIGDEMTKICIACTPFWLFNIIGLNSIHMIKKTRRNIARTKEQLAHQRFKVDYGHLL